MKLGFQCVTSLIFLPLAVSAQTEPPTEVPFQLEVTANNSLWTGAQNSDWLVTGNWNGGVPTTSNLATINSINGPIITSGQDIAAYQILLASTGNAALGVNGGKLSTSGLFNLGSDMQGSLNITNGGNVTSTSHFQLAINSSASSANVSVSGTGSTLNLSTLLALRGSVTINLSDGALMTNSASATFAQDLSDTVKNSTALVTVQTGSTWNSNIIILGITGTATMNILSGGKVNTSGYVIVGGHSSYTSATQRGGTGISTVSGQNSSWNITSALSIGHAGKGRLTISDNATVSAQNIVFGSTIYSQEGILNINTQGLLSTSYIRSTSTAGTQQINIDNGSIKGTQNESNFIGGFSGTQVNIQSGGLTIDTNGYSLTVNSPLSGIGGLTKQSTGTLILTGNHTYTGATIVAAGIMQIQSGASIADSGVTVNSNASLIVNGNINNTTTSNIINGGLGGVGTIAGNTTINGTLAPGNSIGTINFSNNLTLTSTASVNIELLPASHLADFINVGGSINLGGATLQIDLAALAQYEDEAIIDILSASSLTGSWNSNSFTDTNNRLWTFGFENNTGFLKQIVPESSAYALIFGIAGLAFTATRRKRK